MDLINYWILTTRYCRHEKLCPIAISELSTLKQEHEELLISKVRRINLLSLTCFRLNIIKYILNNFLFVFAI